MKITGGTDLHASIKKKGREKDRRGLSGRKEEKEKREGEKEGT